MAHWVQRFENYLKAYQRLEKAVAQDTYSDLEQAGLIKTFEFTFEQAWKTLKDLLSHEGFNVKSPRETLKKAFEMELITNGDAWLLILSSRNIMVHSYDERQTLETITLIKEKYFHLFENLTKKLADRHQHNIWTKGQ